MNIYDQEAGLGIGALDRERLEAETTAYLDGVAYGREQGRRQAHGDWIVGLVLIAFAIVLSGWFR